MHLLQNLLSVFIIIIGILIGIPYLEHWLQQVREYDFHVWNNFQS